MGTYRLYNRHYIISIANDVSKTQEFGQATSLYHTISFGLVTKRIIALFYLSN